MASPATKAAVTIDSPSLRRNAGVPRASAYCSTVGTHGSVGPSAPEPARKLNAAISTRGTRKNAASTRNGGPATNFSRPRRPSISLVQSGWRSRYSACTRSHIAVHAARCSSVTSGVKFVDSRMLGSSRPKASTSTGSSIADITSSLAQP